MPLKTKAIQVLVNSSLPEDIRDYTRSYNKKSINELMSAAANKHEDAYTDIITNLTDIGRNAAYRGGETLTLDDFRPLFDKDADMAKMDEEVKQVNETIKDSNKKKEAINDIYARYATDLETKTMSEGLKKQNNLFNVINSGARGNSSQLKMLVTTPGVYTDAKGNIIPLFIRNSYGEGLSLPEYLASTYGTRSAVVANKRATARSGAQEKSMVKALASTIITKHKDDSPDKMGFPLDVNSDDVYGRVLARDTYGLKKGTVLDRDAVSFLKKHKVNKILIKSPIASKSAEGISAEAFGLDYNKKLPPLGFSAGMLAGSTLLEPVTQGALNCLEENTEVLMGNGIIKKVKDILPDDDVLGADKKGIIKVAKVTHKFNQGVLPVYRYTLENGAVIECTENHKFLSCDGSK